MEFVSREDFANNNKEINSRFDGLESKIDQIVAAMARMTAVEDPTIKQSAKPPDKAKENEGTYTPMKESPVDFDLDNKKIDKKSNKRRESTFLTQSSMKINFDPKLFPSYKGDTEDANYESQFALEQYNKTNTVISNVEPFSETLTDLTVRDVLKLFVSMYDYQQKYRVEIKLQYAVSPAIREVMMTEYEPGITVQEFNRLDQDTIARVIYKLIIPISRKQWVDTLTRNVNKLKLPESYHPSLFTFKTLYQHIMVYVSGFLQVYNVLAQAKPETIPSVWTKPKAFGGGVDEDTIIGLFYKSMVNNNAIASSIHFMLFPERFEKGVRIPQNFNDLSAYITQFKANLAKELKKVEELAQLMNIIYLWNQHTNGSKPGRLNHVYEANSTEEDSQEVLADLLIQDLALVNTEKVTRNPTISAKKLPCYVILRGTACPKGANCQYSHEISVLENAREEQIQKLKALNFQRILKSEPQLQADSRYRIQRNDLRHVNHLEDQPAQPDPNEEL